jgi:hypothetical protein
MPHCSGTDTGSDTRRRGFPYVPWLTPQVLPRIMVDGPFGSASEDFTKFETILLGEFVRPPRTTASAPRTEIDFSCSWRCVD